MVHRLIVHAGFHKTGTTSIQKNLEAHTDLLTPFLAIQLRKEMKGLCEAARTYSVETSAFNLGLVEYEAARIAEGWNTPVVLLSSEDLSGHMPGWRGLWEYGAAAPLARAMTSAWRQVHGGLDITLIYTTRAPDPWLASCHTQHLRTNRMTMSAAEYATTYAASACLDRIVDAIAQAVPMARVVTVPIEAHGDGLTAAILRMCDVPEAALAKLTPLPRANVSPNEATIREMLALNRSDLSAEAWRAARKSRRKRPA